MGVISKDRIRDLLGTGLSSEIVATAVGCDPSYISQLMGDSEFANSVSQLRSNALMADSARDISIGAIEDKLVDKLDAAVDRMHKPQELLHAFRIINAAKRRGAGVAGSVVVQNKILNLNMPVSVLKQFVMNRASEVIEVDGQTLVTMPAATLLKQLAADHEATRLERDGNTPLGENKYERASRFIPDAITITREG